MVKLRFEWDPRKSRSNAEKHGVTFIEAQSVFYDEFGLLMKDTEHSEQEDRFLLLGISSQLRALVVCHSYREANGIIRIISARKANRLERQQYTSRKR